VTSLLILLQEVALKICWGHKSFYSCAVGRYFLQFFSFPLFFHLLYSIMIVMLYELAVVLHMEVAFAVSFDIRIAAV